MAGASGTAARLFRFVGFGWGQTRKETKVFALKSNLIKGLLVGAVAAGTARGYRRVGGKLRRLQSLGRMLACEG